MASLVATALLFLVTAVAEILGCYLFYLWLREGRTAWALLPAAASLAAFAWLLTLHPTGAARTYAAYGGVYIGVSIGWLWLDEGKVPTRSDLLGASVAMLGMAIIVLGHRGEASPPPPPTAEATALGLTRAEKN